jgi:EpsI family protein
MKRVRWQALAVAALLVSASVAGHVARPTIHLADQQAKLDLEQLFPKKFGAWAEDTSMPVGIVSPDLQAKLNELYAQVLSRTYVNEHGMRIMLSVAYGGDQSDATRAHRPDVCYPAQGFDILSRRYDAVALDHAQLPVRRMVAKLGSRIEPVTFWFAVGEYTAASGQDQKLAQMRYGLRGIIPDGMLVRVSSIGADEAAAFAMQDRFISELKAGMAPGLAPRVYGSKLTH